MEHRRGRRDNTDVAVRFVALPATIGTGRVTNISLTGAFMETQCKLPMKAVIYIEDLEPGRERGQRGAAKRLAATVVRRCTAGVGLEWLAQPSRAALEGQFDPPPSASPVSEEPFVYHLEFID